jgi:5'-3' exonuclease
MRGDPSDGLPGVPGVGDKTAARLIARYGGVEAIIAALDDKDAGFAPGLRNKLAGAKDYLAAALPVCKVALDVKLPAFDPAMPSAPKHPDDLLALAERWNLAGSARRLVDALAG